MDRAALCLATAILLISGVCAGEDRKLNQAVDKWHDSTPQAASWIDAVDTASEQYVKSANEIERVLSEFAASDYTAMVRLPTGSFFGSEAEVDGAEMFPVVDPPNWASEMVDLEFFSANKYGAVPKMTSMPRVATAEHRFVYMAFLDTDVELPYCEAGFEIVDCGSCVRQITEKLSLFVSWSAWRIVRGLDQEDPEAPLRMLACIDEGQELLRELVRSTPDQND